METLRQCRDYLMGAHLKLSVRCHLKNLEYFQTSKVRSRREARWSETPSAYNFVMEHLEGSKNPPDGPSRLPDDEIGCERPVARLLATVSVEPYKDPMRAMIGAQASHWLAVDVTAKPIDQPAANDTGNAGKQSQWNIVAGAVTY